MAAQAAEATEGGEEKKGGRGKLIIVAVAALLLLGGGGAGAAWFFGLFGGDEAAEGAAHGAPAAHEAADAHGAGGEHGGEAAAADGEAGAHGAEAPRSADGVFFVDLPDVLVNLRSEGQRMRYLKLRVALEVRDATTAGAVRSLMPRVMDSLQLYLRSLSVEDVRGAIGMERLKEEMLARINRAIRPHRVDDVLFKEMLVQ